MLVNLILWKLVFNDMTEHVYKIETIYGISRKFVKKSNFAKWGLCSIEYTRFSIEKDTYYGLLPDLKFKMLPVDEIIFMVTPSSLAFPNQKDESVPLQGLRK